MDEEAHPIEIYHNRSWLRPPRWVLVTLALTCIGALMSIGVAFYARDVRLEQENKRCQFSVEARDDQRAVWLFLMEQYPATPEQAAFREFFEHRLPGLRCTNDRLTPVEATP